MNMLSRKLASVGLAVALAIGFGLGAAAPANASTHHYSFVQLTYVTLGPPASTDVVYIYTTRGHRHGTAVEHPNGMWTVRRGTLKEPTRLIGTVRTIGGAIDRIEHSIGHSKD